MANLLDKLIRIIEQEGQRKNGKIDLIIAATECVGFFAFSEEGAHAVNYIMTTLLRKKAYVSCPASNVCTSSLQVKFF